MSIAPNPNEVESLKKQVGHLERQIKKMRHEQEKSQSIGEILAIEHDDLKKKFSDLNDRFKSLQSELESKSNKEDHPIEPANSIHTKNTLHIKQSIDTTNSLQEKLTQFVISSQAHYAEHVAHYDKSIFFSNHKNGIKNAAKVTPQIIEVFTTKIADIKPDESQENYEKQLREAMLKTLKHFILNEHYSGYKPHSFRAYLHQAYKMLLDETSDLNKFPSPEFTKKQMKILEQGWLLEMAPRLNAL